MAQMDIAMLSSLYCGFFNMTEKLKKKFNSIFKKDFTNPLLVTGQKLFLNKTLSNEQA
jgi:hypothetical protein